MSEVWAWEHLDGSLAAPHGCQSGTKSCSTSTDFAPWRIIIFMFNSTVKLDLVCRQRRVLQQTLVISTLTTTWLILILAPKAVNLQHKHKMMFSTLQTTVWTQGTGASSISSVNKRKGQKNEKKKKKKS